MIGERISWMGHISIAERWKYYLLFGINPNSKGAIESPTEGMTIVWYNNVDYNNNPEVASSMKKLNDQTNADAICLLQGLFGGFEIVNEQTYFIYTI